MTTDPPSFPAVRGSSGRGRLPRLQGVRGRLLMWFVLLLALATLASVLVIRQILLNRLDLRIDRELVQESQELRALARSGRDPDTGRPFGNDVARMFAVFLQNNVPAPNEAMITLVNGEPYLRSRQVLPYRLDQDEELVRRWGALKDTERRAVQTPAGRVEYLGVPVFTGDGQVPGVFVVAVFRDLEMDETDSAVTAVAATGVAVLLIGSLLAWLLADRIISPVERIRQIAQSISTTDLTRRIDVRGNDEISDLANTFNQMLDELEEGFKSEKQFLDDVGHELRTPITVVRGHLETMGTGPEDRQKTLALVTDELDRMARFVNDLLMLARSERPDFLHLETVDVGALTDELFVKAATMAQRTWVLEECGRGIIEADRQRLTQALLELARNATKHTSEGDQISIGSKVSAHQAEFWVTDCGEGVPTADRERIFQRFQRGDRARKGSGDSGLGLAIVTAIAEAHHGRVELDTESGCGATFRLVIPTDQPLNREGTVSHA